MTEPESVEEVFAEMKRRFDAPAAAGIDVTYRFVLSGRGGGTWSVVVRDGVCAVHSGEVDRPNLTVEMEAADYLEMVAGRLDPQVAFISERLRLRGDLSLATRMQSLFAAPNR